MAAVSAESATPHQLEITDYVGAARPGRVLLAEDDSELRRLLATVLLEDGYQVEEVTTGFEFLVRACFARSTGHALDLIISDVRLPGMTGLEVLAGLRSSLRPGGWDTPVIFITAFGDQETHAEAERLDAAIFDKPFDLDDLRTSVINMVSRVQVKSQREQTDRQPKDLPRRPHRN